MTAAPARIRSNDLRRPVVLGGVAALHVALLALLTGGSRAVPAAQQGAIVVRAIAAPVVPAVAVIPPPMAAVVVDVAMPAVEVADATPGSDCFLSGAIAAALAHDHEVAAAVAAQPATALMVWDGSWAPDPSPAQASIRRLITERIAATSAACRDMPMTGPRLFIVPNGAAPVAVAIGSGVWRWSQLLA